MSADLDCEQILSLGIRFAGVYKTVDAIPVNRNDPTSEIVRDFLIGFKTIGMEDQTNIARGLRSPDMEDCAVEAVKDAAWAAMRNSGAFYSALATSLGRVYVVPSNDTNKSKQEASHNGKPEQEAPHKERSEQDTPQIDKSEQKAPGKSYHIHPGVAEVTALLRLEGANVLFLNMAPR